MIDMDLAERYRTEAEHCLSEAARFRDKRRRATWEALARRWIDLAEQLKARAHQPAITHRGGADRAKHRNAA
jgi:hypothetical protein